MTKILVLGSKGFLGSRVTNLLMQQQNTEVIPHDRSIFSLSDVAQLTSFLEFHRPDAIALKVTALDQYGEPSTAKSVNLSGGGFSLQPDTVYYSITVE